MYDIIDIGVSPDQPRVVALTEIDGVFSRNRGGSGWARTVWMPRIVRGSVPALSGSCVVVLSRVFYVPVFL